jgi:predicted RNA binding protein YcfA (HicA-like mRNA interferase family)
VTSVSGKQLCRALERNGWTLARINGSHHIYVKSGELARISVRVHGNVSLKTGLLRALLKIAGLTERDVTDQN